MCLSVVVWVKCVYVLCIIQKEMYHSNVYVHSNIYVSLKMCRCGICVLCVVGCASFKNVSFIGVWEGMGEWVSQMCVSGSGVGW